MLHHMFCKFVFGCCFNEIRKEGVGKDTPELQNKRPSSKPMDSRWLWIPVAL